MRTAFTIGDLLRHGDAAARAGTPVTPRWAQGRAALLLLQHVCDDLDRIPVGDFDTTFPDDFAALEPALAQRFPSAHSYRAVRRDIPQLLSLMGMGLDDGWDSIRTLARVHHGERAFRTLVYLATPAREAALKPSEVTPAWAFAHDAGLRRSRRWSFRKSLKILDALFDVPKIAASGLLPATRIGPPPVNDKGGSVRDPLPPRLAALCAASKSPAERRFVSWLWTALRRADCPGLPLDPSADDLLAPTVLDRIEALSPDGIKGSSFGIYRTGAVRVLRAHATRPCAARRFRNAAPPAGLPAHLSAICGQAANPGDPAVCVASGGQFAVRAGWTSAPILRPMICWRLRPGPGSRRSRVRIADPRSGLSAHTVAPRGGCFAAMRRASRTRRLTTELRLAATEDGGPATVTGKRLAAAAGGRSPPFAPTSKAVRHEPELCAAMRDSGRSKCCGGQPVVGDAEDPLEHVAGPRRADREAPDRWSTPRTSQIVLASRFSRQLNSTTMADGAQQIVGDVGHHRQSM